MVALRLFSAVYVGVKVLIKGICACDLPSPKRMCVLLKLKVSYNTEELK